MLWLLLTKHYLGPCVSGPCVSARSLYDGSLCVSQLPVYEVQFVSGPCISGPCVSGPCLSPRSLCMRPLLCRAPVCQVPHGVPPVTRSLPPPGGMQRGYLEILNWPYCVKTGRPGTRPGHLLTFAVYCPQLPGLAHHPGHTKK